MSILNIFKTKNKEKYLLDKIKKELNSVVSQKFFIEIPPDHIDADIALSLQDTKKIQQEEQRINSAGLDYVEKAFSTGPFLNIRLKKEKIYSEILEEINKKGFEYGNTPEDKKGKILVEYSSPNIAKPMSVAHLRSTIIGESLSRIYESAGFKVIRVNYLGDWGTQFGKLICAYQKWGDKDKIENNPIGELKNLYVKFNKKAEEDESLNDEARKVSSRLDGGDEELMRLWKKIRDLSIREFEKIYKKLGVEFDEYIGESFFKKSAEKVIDECVEKKVCETGENNSIIAKVENLPPVVLKRGDGSTLYSARDLALLKYRVTENKPDEILYVVGGDQSLYFKQLFAVAESMGFLSKVHTEHVSFGMVLMEGKKMATRKGRVMPLKDLINESIARSREIVEEKNPELSPREKDAISEEVGVGAVIYAMLRQSRVKDIEFNWHKVLNLESSSSVYLQYTYARSKSIIRKYEDNFGEKARKPKKFLFDTDIEFSLAKKMIFFPEVISKAVPDNSPHTLCSFLEDLAQKFNTFYNSVSVINTENDDLRDSRLFLVQNSALIIKKGLSLLGVKTPEKM